MAVQLMRRFAGDRLDGPGAFQFQDVPVPVPGPTEVLVRVDAVGFGYVDALLVRGRYQARPDLPYVPGGEIAGTIVAVGERVENWTPDDRIAAWRMGGGCAEFAVLAASDLVAIPGEVSSVEAAAIILDYLTAHYALTSCGHLAAGEKVLVLGASGGVGGAAVHLAAAKEAFVVAAASGTRKQEEVKARGASAVVDYSCPDWRDSLKIALDGSPLNMVIDPVGGDLTEPAFRSLGKEGRYLVIGFASGEIAKLPLNLALLKSASLIGVDFRYAAAIAPDQVRYTLRELFNWLAIGKIAAPPIIEFPFKSAEAALRALDDRSRIGKVVLVIPSRDSGI